MATTVQDKKIILVSYITRKTEIYQKKKKSAQSFVSVTIAKKWPSFP